MAEEDEAVEEGGKGKKPILMIIIVAVLCIGVGLGAAYFMFSPGGDAEVAEKSAEGEDGEAEAGEGETEGAKDAFYFSLDPAFVVNFQGKGRARFLQVNIDGMTRIEQVKIDVTKHLPQIRNNIVLLLSSKSYEDLITPEGKEAVRAEVLSEIQKVMEDETGQGDSVENIFFTSFVMQ